MSKTRPPRIEITPNLTGFEARCGAASVPVVASECGFTIRDGIRPGAIRRVGLVEYRKLVEQVVHALKFREELDHYGGQQAVVNKVRWRLGKHRAAIGKDVHREWTRILADADPSVLSVQRALFAATCTCPELALALEFYRRPALVRDAQRYRAFAAVLKHAEHLAGYREEHRLRRLPQFAELEALAAKDGLTVDLRSAAARLPWEMSGPKDQDTTQILDRLEDDWRGLLSPTGESYRSLRRTIERLPGGIPPGLLRNLTSIHLQRPIVDRIELLALLLSVRRGHNQHHLVFERSSREQLLGAVELVAGHTHEKLSPRRVRDIRFMVDFLSDYPGGHEGAANGLARKSIRWHRETAERDNEEMLSRVGKRETARPPIDLPSDDELKFLGHTYDLVHEGSRMQNCVATYARRAVQGWCFVFHVDRGEGATVVVDERGSIHEARGPNNQRTSAAKWGRRKLAAWGAEFPPDYTPATAGPALAPEEPIPF